MKVFAQLRQGLILQQTGHHRQQRLAEQRQIGQQRCLARARAVLAHQGGAPRPRTTPILNFCMGKNTPERKDFIMENLVVTAEE